MTINDEAKLLWKAAEDALRAQGGGDAENGVSGSSGGRPITLRRVGYRCGYETWGLIEVTIGGTNGEWRFMMHDGGNYLRVLVNGKQVGHFPGNNMPSEVDGADRLTISARLTGVTELLAVRETLWTNTSARVVRTG